MAIAEFWWINTDTAIIVDELQRVLTGAYVNDATVTAKLMLESTEVVVTGAEAIDCAYVAASDGKYVGTLPNTLALTAETRYILELTIVGPSYKLVERLAREARYMDPTQ
jgi:hypothetical protein